MVSLPTYDNNQFATGIADEYAVYLNDPASRCATTPSPISTRRDRPSSW